MTDVLGLGSSDADPRWVGVRRHQVTLCLVALACVGIWFLVSGASDGFIVMALIAVVFVTPLPSGDTVATLVATAARFAIRPRWTTLHYDDVGEAVSIRRRTTATFTPISLEHVGRLDLSGRDRDVVATLKEVAQSLAATSTGGHVALMVDVRDESVTTTLCAKERPPMYGWRSGASAPLCPPGAVLRVVHERWRCVATIDGYLMVVRLRGFAPWSDYSPLAPLQLAGVPLTVALHCEVVSQLRAMRMTGRAVHRLGSDATAVSALGFRRSARSEIELARVSAREQRVASGQALMQAAVYVVLAAESMSALQDNWNVVRRTCRENGLGVASGVGRQAQWFRWAHPGGFEW